MISVGVIGMEKWWEVFSAANPNVHIEETLLYFLFRIIAFALEAALAMQTIFILLLVTSFFIRTNDTPQKDSSQLKNKPVCPNCKETMDVIRKGTRDEKERFYCKTCKKYFTKKE
jgi:hypothetical protein